MGGRGGGAVQSLHLFASFRCWPHVERMRSHWLWVPGALWMRIATDQAHVGSPRLGRHGRACCYVGDAMRPAHTRGMSGCRWIASVALCLVIGIAPCGAPSLGEWLSQMELGGARTSRLPAPCQPSGPLLLIADRLCLVLLSVRPPPPPPPRPRTRPRTRTRTQLTRPHSARKVAGRRRRYWLLSWRRMI